MANFLFLTFYDKICLGPRILSSIVKNAGHKSNLILFKEDSSDKIIWGKNKSSVNYEHYKNGFLRGSNYDINAWTDKEIDLLVDLVLKLKPDVVCLSTRSFWTTLGNQIITAIRRKMPKIPIVAGGWGPTLEPEKYLEYCDYVCFGEGEQTIVDIGKSIDNNKDFRNIKNIIYKGGVGTIYNDLYEPLKNLDSVPIPDFNLDNSYLIENNRILKEEEFYNEKIYDVFVGRGCPLKCSYCMSGMWKDLYKKYGFNCLKIRTRDPKLCIEEIKRAKDNGAVVIRFKDEVFPFNKKWVAEFLKFYKKEINLPFFAYLRPEFHTIEMVEELYVAGLRTTGLGIQTGSENIRQNIYHRKCDNTKIAKFAEFLDVKGINYAYDIITNNPFESERDLKSTFCFLCSLPFADLKVFKIKFFPGAPITNMLKLNNPTSLGDNLYKWYSVLYFMAVRNKMLRKIAVVVEKIGLFKFLPSILQAVMLPYLISEKIKSRKMKKKYKTISASIPKP